MNIAMRDLDIRGAGNLLGAEQSGFMADIGIETYQKILEEAMQELKQDQFKEMLEEEEIDSQQFVKDTAMETDFEILFPDDYVSQIAERITLYKELDSCTNETELQAFVQRLIDRFGPLPEQALDLIQTIRLRWVASAVGFEKLIIKSGLLIGYFVSREDSPYYQSPAFTGILEFMKYNPRDGEMYEKNGGLRMKFTNVNNIADALKILEKLQPKKVEEV